MDKRLMWKYWKWNKIHGDIDGVRIFSANIFIFGIIIDVEICFFFQNGLILLSYDVRLKRK
jgi:hypothetical protein